MNIKLMYVTNDPDVAVIAQHSGVDRIFIDLEVRGKQQRQGHIDSVKSNHSLTDIDKIKNLMDTSQLLVRSNPIYEDSKKEIEEIVQRGADIVMLPMWRTMDDVKRFLDYVNGRAKTLLLLETIDAEHILDEVLEYGGFDEIHIGLNDLHLEYHQKFLFELLANGKVDEICSKISQTSFPFGFGGIASLNKGLLSGKNVLAEHYRLHSQISILSRSFCNTEKIKDKDLIQEIFTDGIKEIREYETFLEHCDDDFFKQNHLEVIEKVNEIVKHC